MYVYHTNCVESTARAITPMIDNAIDITRRTFLKHVNRESLAGVSNTLGYERDPRRGLTMAGDWHVSYHRSKFRGRKCYYLRWSGIEYIFIVPLWAKGT